MKNNFLVSRHFILSALFLIFCVPKVSAIPMYNRYETFPIYSVYGTDKFFAAKEGFEASFQITPFYQHASGARDKDGIKVPEGDIFGRWNMFGLFYGYTYQYDKFANASYPNEIPASLSTKSFKFKQIRASAGLTPTSFNIPDDATQKNYPNLSYAWRVLDSKAETDDANDPVNKKLAYDYTDQQDKGVGFESAYNAGLPFVYIDHEKYGLRGQLNFDFKWGLGFKIRGGAVSYRQIPEFRYGTITGDAETIKQYLTSPEKIQAIAKEIGLDVSTVDKTALEDTHLQMDLFVPFDLKDSDDELVVTMAPYCAIGLWCPTGQKKNVDQPFSLPTGNDGHWGGTVDASICFDFPGTVQLSVGGGAAFYSSEDVKGYRMPVKIFTPRPAVDFSSSTTVVSNVFDNRVEQSGIYPWKIDIKRRPGTVWYVNASFKAYLFTEYLSFFFDYIYTQHNKDHITLKDDSSVTINRSGTVTTVSRKDLFLPQVIEEDSKWKDNLVHCGLNYTVSDGLEIGVGFDAHISGIRVYKNTTLFGTMTFNF